MRSADLHILTGAPGSGKTAILDNIAADIRCVGEPAREILAEQRAIDGDGTSDGNASLFVELLLQRSIDKHVSARTGNVPVLFDRGVPDCIAYASAMGIDPSRSIRAAERYRYHDQVLMLPPWEEIYTVDDERTMSFADTLPFHDALVDAYERARYVIVEVPRGSIELRAAFVRDSINHP
jgi:predicted ATPase